MWNRILQMIVEERNKFNGPPVPDEVKEHNYLVDNLQEFREKYGEAALVSVLDDLGFEVVKEYA